MRIPNYKTVQRAVACGLALAMIGLVIPAEAAAKKKDKPKKAVSVGGAAGIGALLGLALGDDPLEAAARGAVLGAAGGAIANAATKSKREREYEEKKAMEAAKSDKERELVAREARLAELEDELGTVVAARQQAVEGIVEAIGGDNWEGYKALRGCQHGRASALGQAGRTSTIASHNLASYWLEAMVAVDGKDRAKADSAFQDLIERDPDIDTIQQASLATDQAVLDMRAERADLGIGSCQ